MSTTSNQKYCVNWKDHASHVQQAFDNLLCSNELTDVMIYCEGKKISAHRMVLSACSTYFREIFKNNLYQNPIIVIPGMEYAVLTAIIRFIYQGEVSVDMAKLDMFLKTAQLLQISGLTKKANDRGINEIEQKENAERVEAQQFEEGTTVASSSVGLNEEVRSRRGNKQPKIKVTTEFVEEHSARREKTQLDYENKLLTGARCEPEEFFAFKDVIEDSLLLNENQHKDYITDTTLTPTDNNGLKPESDIMALPNIRELESSVVHHNLSEEPLKCLVCSKVFIHPASLRHHQAVHAGNTECPICHAILSRKYNLKMHMKAKHNMQYKSN